MFGKEVTISECENGFIVRDGDYSGSGRDMGLPTKMHVFNDEKALAKHIEKHFSPPATDNGEK